MSINPITLMMMAGRHDNFLNEMMDTMKTSNMACYQPRFVYGVKEKSRSTILSKVLLDRHAPQVQCFVTDVIRFHGGDIIYGCEITVGEALSGKRVEQMEPVDRFAKEFGLGKPKIHVAIKGNYKSEHDEYEPEEGRAAQDDSRKESDDEDAGESSEGSDEGEVGRATKKSRLGHSASEVEG